MSHDESSGSYPFKKIEQKWQKFWEENETFKATEDSNKEKYYTLIEFPYPSGVGLHIGHPRSYTAFDAVARKKRMEGKNVLFPMGFDSFGAPAEQYAVKTGQHPKITTEKSINVFIDQLKNLGLSFDWSRCIATTDPKYYKWTQWMFLQFYKAGMAYKSTATINWCAACKMALTNEELEKGKCERCGGIVEQKEKSQWTLKMKSYSDKLLDGLDKVNYTDNIKAQQRNWIGKSVGAEIDFEVKSDISEKLNMRVYDGVKPLKVFTTRPDTIFGTTFMVIAPEHPLLEKSQHVISNWTDVEDYKSATKQKTEMERLENKVKTGVRLEGMTAINPFTGKPIPIFIADYVMMGYGTGAIMAVPGHDQRDYEFAKKYDLPITEVISGDDLNVEAYMGDGKMINSEFLNGMTKQQAIDAIIAECEKRKIGQKTINYKMRDWLFTRQRYWGEPIPMVHCEKCGWQPIPESELPLELPEIDDYLPTEDGEAPLAKATDWVNTTCPKCKGAAKRETDTMPTWAGSSWYYLRYMDPHNDTEFASKEKMKYWGQVDLYNGGQEHTTRHLLYARFWHKMLYDMGHVPFDEPFSTRVSHGMILAENGVKMSKSKGNVINPNDIVDEYGADSLRMYEMFIGPYTEAAAWNTKGLIGISRFLNKVYRLMDKITDREMTADELKILHKTIRDVGDRIDTLKFNTAISALMEAINAINQQKDIAKDFIKTFIRLIYPFAPHMAEEMYQALDGSEQTMTFVAWPKYDEKYLVEDSMKLMLQVNGKNRSEITIPIDTSKEEIKKLALSDERMQKFMDGKEPRKIIIVPKRLVNVVV